MTEQNIETISELEYAIFTFHSSPIAINLKYLERFNLIDKIIKIPRSPPFVLGVIRVEKAIIPLIDLEILLGSRKNIELKDAISLIITVENNVFALFTSSVPKVQTFDPNEIVKKIDGEILVDIPKDWIEGYIKSSDFTDSIPIINPKLFWIGLGDISIVGPSLQYQEDAEIKLEEPVEDIEIKPEEPVEDIEIKPEEPVEDTDIKPEEPVEDTDIKPEEPVEEHELIEYGTSTDEEATAPKKKAKKAKRGRKKKSPSKERKSLESDEDI
jgi:purine-binding chemotaxis protein CheW